MSDTVTKEKHSKRIHAKETAVAKQVKLAKTFGVKADEPHRFAKHHAMDCGHTDCWMCCNPRKTSKERTIQEKRFYQDDEYHSYHSIDTEDTEVPIARST